MGIARRLGSLHDIHHALVGRLGVGIDDHHRIAAFAGGPAQGFGYGFDVGGGEGDLFTRTCPLAVTATSISLGFSGCLLASAVGRLISSPENLA